MGNLGGCIFCKIASKEIPSDIVFESEDTIGFKDVHPQAPVHLLLIPKKHIRGVDEIDAVNKLCVSRLILAANQLTRQLNIDQSGFRLVINAKSDGGQTVEHLHMHLLGGRSMGWPPG